ncbi:MAG: hypothetical protein GWO04_31090, partial [Actinobacteria bacterium]|nr:hypothetical protein [Actinomycetota bacterium]
MDPRDGSGGRGIAVESGGLLTLRRGLIYRNVELGISAFNPGTEVNAEDVTIIRTDTSPQVAVGLGSYDEAH